VRLSNVLLAEGMVTTAGVEQAIARQNERGGPMTDNLLALDLVPVVDLDTALKQVWASPSSIEKTGRNPEKTLGHRDQVDPGLCGTGIGSPKRSLCVRVTLRKSRASNVTSVRGFTSIAEKKWHSAPC